MHFTNFVSEPGPCIEVGEADLLLTASSKPNKARRALRNEDNPNSRWRPKLGVDVSGRGFIISFMTYLIKIYNHLLHLIVIESWEKNYSFNSYLSY